MITNERDELVDLVWRVETRDQGGVTLRDAEAVADAILARYAIVELPEPVRCTPDIAEDLDDPFEFRAPWGTYYVIDGRIESDSGPTWSPASARMEAAAMLAAANRAEVDQ